MASRTLRRSAKVCGSLRGSAILRSAASACRSEGSATTRPAVRSSSSILQHVPGETDCLILAGLELIAGEGLGHTGMVPRVGRGVQGREFGADFPNGGRGGTMRF